MRTLRFVEGEPAIVCKTSPVFGSIYTGMPCHVVERGPMAYPYNFRIICDYIVAMCDGRQVYINDDCLKKIDPPADDLADTEEVTEELEHV